MFNPVRPEPPTFAEPGDSERLTRNFLDPDDIRRLLRAADSAPDSKDGLTSAAGAAAGAGLGVGG